MKHMLIIQPHWPPSNLVGVHRVRLIANELHTLGWKAVVLAVDERDYEEELVPEMTQLVASEVEVIKVRIPAAPTILGKRLYGDIALRGWSQLKTEALEILNKRKIDFIWLSLPPWYISLLGPILKRYSGVPYGVDYRDPWIYQLAPHEKGLNRAFLALLAARILEPRALKAAALITGVSDGYVEGVRTRYRFLEHIPFLTFQMGFARRDHVVNLDFPLPFTPGKRTYVYAGAHWSMGAPLFSLWLKALAALHRSSPLENVEFLFIGTGRPDLPSITGQIHDLGIADIAREIPERLSYLSVQKILRESDGAMVIGSIEAHYSASKIFQCLVTAPRLFAFFHEASVGKTVLEQCNADSFYVPFHNDMGENMLIQTLGKKIAAFADPQHPWKANLEPLEEYTTNRNAQKFLSAVEQIISATS